MRTLLSKFPEPDTHPPNRGCLAQTSMVIWEQSLHPVTTARVCTRGLLLCPAFSPNFSKRAHRTDRLSISTLMRTLRFRCTKGQGSNTLLLQLSPVSAINTEYRARQTRQQAERCLLSKRLNTEKDLNQCQKHYSQVAILHLLFVRQVRLSILLL